MSTVCWFWPAASPRTVRVNVPAAAAPPTLMVAMLEATPGPTCGGANPTVTPVGSATAVSDTETVKVPVRATVMLTLPVPLRAIDIGAPVAVSEKLPPAGGGLVLPPLPPPQASSAVREKGAATLLMERGTSASERIVKNPGMGQPQETGPAPLCANRCRKPSDRAQFTRPPQGFAPTAGLWRCH
jgi:hypothetical protein